MSLLNLFTLLSYPANRLSNILFSVERTRRFDNESGLELCQQPHRVRYNLNVSRAGLGRGHAAWC